MVKLRVASAEVDPAFCCRLCKTRAYHEDGVTRSAHPGCIDNRPLYRLNSRLDDACVTCIDVIYRNHPLANQTLACVKDIEKSDASLGEFLEKRESIMRAQLAEASSGVGHNIRGESVWAEEGIAVDVTKGAFTFYPDKLYPHGDPATNGLGHTPLKFNGVKGVAIFDLPAGVVPL